MQQFKSVDLFYNNNLNFYKTKLIIELTRKIIDFIINKKLSLILY